MVARGCAGDCGTHRDRSDYSSNQWSKGVGKSRCKYCVEGVPAPPTGRPTTKRGGRQRSGGGRSRPPATDTLRKNESNEASYTAHALDNPFAEGTFRLVAKGCYTSGPRNGEASVCKWFKSGGVMEAKFFELDIKAV